MTIQWTEQAHAKVNLILAVGDRRSDGYHDVATVLHMLNLSDTVYIEADRGRSSGSLNIDVTTTVAVTAHKRDNLAYRACILLEDEIVSQGYNRVRIHIRKRIPMGAGLAGGSADAAAVLRGITKALQLQISDDELLRRAATIGSDVPACVIGGTVVGTGRGEQVRSLSGPSFWWVLAHPGDALSAGDVYQCHASRQSGVPQQRPTCGEPLISASEFDRLNDAFATADPNELAPLLRNDLQPATIEMHEGIGRLLRTMRHDEACSGIINAIVSGSGPTVVGLAKSKDAAVQVAQYLKKQRVPWVWWGESEVRQ